MEKNLRYGVMLSLKEISLRRVTVLLWRNTDALAYFFKYSLVDKVMANMKKLELPLVLTEQMKYLVTPVGTEIKKWKRFHEKNISNSRRKFHRRILGQLCWTIFGSVDYRKTAENLMHIEILDTLERYKLACLYCLEDYIPILWKKLPEWKKAYFYDEGPYDSASRHEHLEFCWPYILKSEENKQMENTNTFYQDVFENSACKGNKAATEFFFQKLTNEEREVCVIRTTRAALRHRFEDYNFQDFPKKKLSETICYLLSIMSPEQRRQICEENVCGIFVCLLGWYWQNIFWDVAEHFWPYLSALDYVRLLKSIFEDMKTSFYTTKLFQEFFLRGPSDFRKCFVDEECQSGFFMRLYHYFGHSETITFIFRNIDSADKKRLIFSRFTFECFCKKFSRHEDRFVEICLQEATPSNEEKQKLKEAYFGFLYERTKNIWKKFLQYLE